MNRFTIRSATSDDVLGMAGIYRRARVDGLPFLPILQSAEKVVPYFHAIIRDETALVAEDATSQILVGFISFTDGIVTFLYVEPKA